MIEHIWVGHFERDGNFVRVDTQERRGMPIVVHPLSSRVVNRRLKECGVSAASVEEDASLPAKWFAYLEQGFLTFDYDALTEQSVSFIRTLVALDGCSVVYAHTFQFISVQFLERWIEERETKRRQARLRDERQ